MVRRLSERAHRQVLEAAAELFAERGIDATSMDAIAHAAQVSKATVYKHWADKQALCLAVLRYVHSSEQGFPPHHSGDVRADLLALLSDEPPAGKADLRKRLMPHLLAYSAKNREFAGAWREQVMGRVREQLGAFLHRGVEQGVFARNLNPDLSVALLWGPMLYGHIVGSDVSRAELARQVVSSFWRAHARAGDAPPQPPARRAATRRTVRGARSRRI